MKQVFRKQFSFAVQERHLIKYAAVYGKYPDRFELWCGFDLTGYDKPGFGPATIAELERCVRLGARGVGEITDKGSGLSRGTGTCHAHRRSANGSDP